MWEPDGSPSNFGEKMEVIWKGDQESAENRLEIIYTGAKHYFEVFWVHLAACRAVNTRFHTIFDVFSRFLEPTRSLGAAPKPGSSGWKPGSSAEAGELGPEAGELGHEAGELGHEAGEPA